MTSPLENPADRQLPTDRESLRALVTALAAEPDILNQLGYALAVPGGLDPQLVALWHQAADKDASVLALHHTLGGASGQAAPGNHDHGIPRIWRRTSNVALPSKVAADAEAKDTGIGDLTITAKTTKEYLVFLTCRVNSAGGAANVDLKLRYTVGTTTTAPAAVTTASAQADAFSVGAISGQPDTRTFVTLIRGDFLTGGVAQLPVNIAAFHDVTTGAGTVTIDQASGSVRRLMVLEGASVA